MRAATATIAGAALVALAGCGGSDSAKPKPKATAPTHSGGRPSAAAIRQQQARQREQALARLEAQRKRARIARAARVKEARRVAAAVVEAAGFPRAKVTVAGAGQRLAVAVAASQACDATPADAARVVAGLKAAIPTVRTVGLTVSGQDVPLARYVQISCRPDPLPSGPGKVAYSHSGNGFFETEPIAIRSNRWAVDYSNQDGRLQITALRDGKLQPTAISAAEPGAGLQAFQGSGTFTLRIAATGSWRIRVRVLPPKHSKPKAKGPATQTQSRGAPTSSG
jgi:hypothetical protein